ncbi:hypothetical protein [Caballeronia sordidicola]|uniref:Mobile element protein n=1 Tax=Caballeronia sordidicola TaxID=196367 RepID=A0A226XA83_CABSO|nr:hypothetical protein [Caballeronia sordidicola]OXC79758.1 hypothetical protein BSU04_04990 [Caballeronia sordidicola]
MGRSKLNGVREFALTQGWLEPDLPLPYDAELAGIFGRNTGVARNCISSLEPFRDLICTSFDAGVQGTTMYGDRDRAVSDPRP